MVIRLKTEPAKAAIRAEVAGVVVRLTAAGGDSWNTAGASGARTFSVTVMGNGQTAQAQKGGAV